MTNVRTLAEKPAVISKTLSEIMVAQGERTPDSANYSKGNGLEKKRTALLMTTLCAFVTEAPTLVSISKLIP